MKKPAAQDCPGASLGGRGYAIISSSEERGNPKELADEKKDSVGGR
jgi:hypothetical protein